jgi:hypothetical protein
VIRGRLRHRDRGDVVRWNAYGEPLPLFACKHISSELTAQRALGANDQPGGEGDEDDDFEKIRAGVSMCGVAEWPARRATEYEVPKGAEQDGQEQQGECETQRAADEAIEHVGRFQ